MYFSNFIKDDNGFTTIEYTITGALVTVSLVGVFAALGNIIAVQSSRVANLIL